MTNEEIIQAERIRYEFPKWDRPMSVEEKRLMERYWEYLTQESIRDSARRGYGGWTDEEEE